MGGRAGAVVPDELGVTVESLGVAGAGPEGGMQATDTELNAAKIARRTKREEAGIILLSLPYSWAALNVFWFSSIAAPFH